MDKKVDDIISKYRKAKSQKQKKTALFMELDAFDRNEQWDLQKAPPWLPRPVTNFVHLVKYTKRAALSVDNPTGKLRATSPDSIKSVEELNKGFQYVWDRIKARKVVRENIGTAKLLGTAIAHVYWEEQAEGRMGTTIHGDKGYRFEGEIKIKEIDPACFYPDPNAFSIEDCNFIHIVERKSIEWIKSQPKFNKSGLDSVQSTNSADDRGEIYNRDYGQGTGLVDFHSHYERVPNKEGGFTYKVTYLAGDKILHEQNLKPNRYPFAILYDFPQRQDFWGMSTCEIILDNQKIINKVESIIAMIGTLMQNPQKVVNRYSGIDPKEVANYGNAPGKTYLANNDPSKAIYYVQPPQIPPALFNLLENAKANIREITGMNEAYMGQSVGSLQTSSGVNSLIDRATMRDRDQMYDIELYIEQLSSLIIDFIVTYYEEARLIRVMGTKPDEYQFIKFVGKDYRDIDYDIAIDVSAKAPITRLKESQDADNLLAMQGQYGGMFPTAIITPQEYVEMKDFTNKDKIITRMNHEEAQNTIEKLNQVLQMFEEARANNVPLEEAVQMADAMFEQIDQQDGMGSTSNANQFQASQGGVAQPIG